MEISDKQKGLTRLVCISFVTFDGFKNLFPAEENDDKLLKKRHAQQSHLELQKQRKRKKKVKQIKPKMTNPKAQPHTKNKISRARGSIK